MRNLISIYLVFFLMCDRLWRGFAHRLNLIIFLKAIAQRGNPETPPPTPPRKRGGEQECF
ncbi:MULTISPECIES: hypothetical protein [unclassified Nodularia (in: cyanobacteria)]|uniref:hypothetical protein n=1 Tax=unclassified Nodularia (in: cyanobacteria) TaxID=2656917 RepID=UPI001882258C|nr:MULTISPECIES: hypothetical protein [unclassified Nodularia (in: cyanobacteria)]MBE9198082.1 hypothetical protein [Nodularia sp. LEGE 06071]MCC2693228.1 hypothetical protein [Nodularia sp. LEGE 04288]